MVGHTFRGKVDSIMKSAGSETGENKKSRVKREGIF